MERNIIIIFIISFFSFSCSDLSHDHSNTKKENRSDSLLVIRKTNKEIIDTVKKSLPAKIENKIGHAHFTILYHSPAVRGRVIWGGLVPYDEVWTTGAHSATSIESDKEFMILGRSIAAGKYALFTIPAKDEWTVIINKNWEQHLADEYKESDDILRFKLRPDTLSYIQERLMYDIDQWAQKEGDIKMMWEKLSITIPVRIK